MIRNLNQLTFSRFGTILPERSDGPSPFPRDKAKEFLLDASTAAMYSAVVNTWICSSGGSCVLSVLSSPRGYQHFYLDKPVCLFSGTQFALSAFMGEAAVLVYAEADPHYLGSNPCEKLRMDRKLHVDGIYTFFYQEKERGFLFPGEAHPVSELTYVDQGALHSVVDGHDLLLKQGDLVIYGPNQWHMQYADVDVAPRFVTISFDFAGMELSSLLNRKFSVPQAAAAILKNMLREQENMDPLSPDIIVSQLNLLLLFLLRESAQPSGSKVRNANVVHSENEIIRRAQQYIAGHIREKLSVPAVAEHVDVSSSYLTVLFHRNLQISPGEYIRRIKLQESKQMIRENDMTFTEIAAALHYSTVHHFSRQFKEKFGITPTEYAKSVR